MFNRRQKKHFSFEKLHGRMRIREQFRQEVFKLNEGKDKKVLSFASKIKNITTNHRNKLYLYFGLYAMSYTFSVYSYVSIQLMKVEPLTRYFRKWVFFEQNDPDPSIYENNYRLGKYFAVEKEKQLKSIFLELEQSLYFGVTQSTMDIFFKQLNIQKETETENPSKARFPEGLTLPEFYAKLNECYLKIADKNTEYISKDSFVDRVQLISKNKFPEMADNDSFAKRQKDENEFHWALPLLQNKLNSNLTNSSQMLIEGLDNLSESLDSPLTIYHKIQILNKEKEKLLGKDTGDLQSAQVLSLKPTEFNSSDIIMNFNSIRELDDRIKYYIAEYQKIHPDLFVYNNKFNS